MSVLTQALEKLGLNEKEAGVYLAILELGSANVQEIAAKSGLKRTNVYNYLNKLKKEGFVSLVETDNRATAVAENPEVLVRRSVENTKGLEKLLPDFLAIFNLPGTKPKVKFYEGVEGIKNAYEQILLDKESIRAVTDVDQMMTVLDNEYMWNFAKRRAEQRIDYQAIAKDGLQAQIAHKKDKQERRHLKLIKELRMGTEINIYGNKVAMMSFVKPCSAVIIEDVSVARTMKLMWQGWWDSLK